MPVAPAATPCSVGAGAFAPAGGDEWVVDAGLKALEQQGLTGCKYMNEMKQDVPDPFGYSFYYEPQYECNGEPYEVDISKGGGLIGIEAPLPFESVPPEDKAAFRKAGVEPFDCESAEIVISFFPHARTSIALEGCPDGVIWEVTDGNVHKEFE